MIQKIANEKEVTKEKKDSFKVWSKVHLSVLEDWTSKEWKKYSRTKDSYFLHPYKWTMIAAGRTEKEASRTAKATGSE